MLDNPAIVETKATPQPKRAPISPRTPQAASHSIPEHRQLTRLTMRPLARGLCAEFDQIEDVAGLAKANKTLLTRAIAAAGDGSKLTLDGKGSHYEYRAGKPLQTKRKLDRRLVERITAECDPLGIKNENELSIEIVAVLVAHYVGRAKN